MAATCSSPTTSISPQGRCWPSIARKTGARNASPSASKDLKISSIYLHRDEQIEATLLINMLALLTYSIPERQTSLTPEQKQLMRMMSLMVPTPVTRITTWTRVEGPSSVPLLLSSPL